mmetsp:Transcript_36999/g.97444  ORF Transcript_36999/g.97444 Transcript_36999/m.97444 type:complete len:462 (-) Transcript_36999:3157-4542(-)
MHPPALRVVLAAHCTNCVHVAQQSLVALDALELHPCAELAAGDEGKAGTELELLLREPQEGRWLRAKERDLSTTVGLEGQWRRGLLRALPRTIQVTENRLGAACIFVAGETTKVRDAVEIPISAHVHDVSVREGAVQGRALVLRLCADHPRGLVPIAVEPHALSTAGAANEIGIAKDEVMAFHAAYIRSTADLPPTVPPNKFGVDERNGRTVKRDVPAHENAGLPVLRVPPLANALRERLAPQELRAARPGEAWQALQHGETPEGSEIGEARHPPEAGQQLRTHGQRLVVLPDQELHVKVEGGPRVDSSKLDLPQVGQRIDILPVGVERGLVTTREVHPEGLVVLVDPVSKPVPRCDLDIERGVGDKLRGQGHQTLVGPLRGHARQNLVAERRQLDGVAPVVEHGGADGPNPGHLGNEGHDPAHVVNGRQHPSAFHRAVGRLCHHKYLRIHHLVPLEVIRH